MHYKREFKVFVQLCVLVVSIGASKCPESRKPHVTSCTIFYNCINLPEGGYVWAPAKCSEGLVFQPYLRICVLPGDAWTCDNPSTEKSVVTESYENPQLIDPSITSYDVYEQDSLSLTDRPSLYSSYPIDGSSELGNLRPLVTPYPLIETVGKEREKSSEPNKSKDTKSSISQSIEQGMENYLYRFFKSHQRLRTRLASVSSINDGEKSEFTWLRGVIDRILLHESIEGFGSRTTCDSSVPDNLRKNNRLDDVNKDMLNYLVENYILGTRKPTGGKTTRRRKNGASTTTEIIKESGNDRVVSTSTSVLDNPAESLIDGSKSENNIVVIEGNLGNREYVTVEKYKSLSSQINLRVIEILPCARGIRLPNRTDCTRYYTCDPETASIVEFSCSSRTAFNDYNRVCDIQRYKTCSRQKYEKSDETTMNPVTTESVSFPDETEVSERSEPCRNTGKFLDSISEKHYYVCYSSQANPSKIESLRMICPNDLIFCQERRVCSTRKRCYDT